MAKISTLLRALACLMILCGFAPLQIANALPGGPDPVLVKDINPTASMGSNPKAFMQAGEVTYFFVTNTYNQNELWKTDGTSQGTVLVKQGVGPGGTQGLHKWVSPPGWYNVYDGIVYFYGVNQVYDELWRSDGTSEGTYRVLDKNGATISGPENLTLFDGKLFFTSGGYMLYQSDGTAQGTKLLFNIPIPTSNVINFNGKLYFARFEYSYNLYRLYEADSTSTNPPTGTDGLELMPDGTLFVFQNSLYFAAREADGEELSHGMELWRIQTNGQVERVKDINLSGDANPVLLGEINGWLIFAAQDGVNGSQIWRTDGTEGGTTLIQDFTAGQGINLSTIALGEAGGKLQFLVSGNLGDDGLWTTGGTPENTSRIGDAAEWEYQVSSVYGDQLYYSASHPASGQEVWVTDGTAGGMLFRDILTGPRSSMPRAMALCGSRLCISADDGQHGMELWSSDGTRGGTILVANLNTYPVGSDPKGFKTAGMHTFFFADDQVSVENLWRSDGSLAGTLALNQNPGVTFIDSHSYDPGQLVSIGDHIFFTASEAAHGRELWSSDGTLGGTGIVKDIRPGASDSWVEMMTAVGGRLFFTANNGTSGRELWVSDGSASGTQMVKAIIAPEDDTSKFYSAIAPYGNGVVFVIFDTTAWTGGLWISDGTEAGTHFVATLPEPGKFSQANGLVYFSSWQNTSSEAWLYQSDGTSEGTTKVGSLGFPNGIYEVVSVGENVFALTTDFDGVKLFVMRGQGSGLEPLHTFSRINEINPNLIYTAAANGKLGMVIFEYDEDIDGEGVHLWMSDGTVEGTLLMPGDYDFIQALQANEDGFIFNAESGTERRQIWKSDGTPEGTEQLTHFPQSMCLTHEMGLLGDAILLPLDDFKAGGTTGCELWTVMDGLWREIYIPAVLK